MEFYEDKNSFDASAWMHVEQKAPLHYEGLDTTVPSSVTDSVSNPNSHVCAISKDTEATTMWDFFTGALESSPTPEIFPRNPYASATIDVGDYRDGIFTGNNSSGSQADDIESEVDLAEIVPSEAVPIPFPSSKDNL